MVRFLIKTLSFLFYFLIILALVLRYSNGSLNIDFKRFKDKLFFKKLDLFNEFSSNNSPINIIFGSSTIKEAIIPDSLGANWFSFTNPNQNIYESYKFLKYYSHTTKIDTILYGLQPFDFPYSYIKNRENDSPLLNGNFHLFGIDSITSLKETTYLRDIQAFKESHFPDIQGLIDKISKVKVKRDKQDVWTKQGFSGRINIEPIDIDTLKEINVDRIEKYFYNIKMKPNFLFFDMFNSLANSLGIHVIYIVTPKAEQYKIARMKEKKDKAWSQILLELKKKNIEVLNLESMVTDTFNILFYRDAIHLSYDGAKVFTNIIKDKINK